MSDSTSKRRIRDWQRLTYVSLANLDEMKTMLQSTTLGAHEDTVYCTRTYVQHALFRTSESPHCSFVVHLPCSTKKLLFCSATTLHVIDTKRAAAPRRLNET